MGQVHFYPRLVNRRLEHDVCGLTSPYGGRLPALGGSIDLMKVKRTESGTALASCQACMGIACVMIKAVKFFPAYPPIEPQHGLIG